MPNISSLYRSEEICPLKRRASERDEVQLAAHVSAGIERSASGEAEIVGLSATATLKVLFCREVCPLELTWNVTGHFQRNCLRRSSKFIEVMPRYRISSAASVENLVKRFLHAIPPIRLLTDHLPRSSYLKVL